MREPAKRRVALLTVPIPRVPELGSEIVAGSTLIEALSLSLRVGLDQTARCEPPQLPPQNLSLSLLVYLRKSSITTFQQPENGLTGEAL